MEVLPGALIGIHGALIGIHGIHWNTLEYMELSLEYMEVLPGALIGIQGSQEIQEL